MKHACIAIVGPRIWRFSVLALLVVGSISAAAITVTGIVVDPDDAPAPGVTVSTSSHEAVTGEDGAFRLEGLDAGDLLLRLAGDTGEGHVRVTIDEPETSLHLTYPVVTTVVLLHDNDTHFNYNHIEAFEGAIHDVRNRYENVYLLSAGDFFVRHADRWHKPNDTDFYREMCFFMIDAMNAIEYDVATLGNHELDYIEGYTREALERAEFPLLGANIDLETDNIPPLKPYVVFETDNELSIAVLGITRRSGGTEGVEMRDFHETAQAYTPLAEEHNAYIALTHIGLNADRELAAAVPALDVIIGGHSNHVLEEGELINDVLVAMAGGPPSGHRHAADPEWPKYLGKVTLTFENDRLADKKARLMTFQD